MQILLIISNCSPKECSAVKLNTDSVCNTQCVCLSACLQSGFAPFTVVVEAENARFEVFTAVLLRICLLGCDVVTLDVWL
jgi:hypothetical protein